MMGGSNRLIESKRQQQQRKGIIIPASVCFGILLGIVFMQAWTNLDTISIQVVDSNNDSISPQQKDQCHLPVTTKGWHPIHVYYGKEDVFLDDASRRPMGSQVFQDEIVTALFQKQGKNDGGYFVDLAANDATQSSNSYMLEQKGWTGLCIEGNPEYWYKLSFRKCHVIGAFVGQDSVDAQEQVEVYLNGAYGGIMRNDTDNKPSVKHKKKKRGVAERRYTISLRSVFAEFRTPKIIDYMSLDVEGAESIVMHQFPFDEYKFYVLTIERPKEDLKALLEQHGYKFVSDISKKKFSKMGETLWIHASFGLSVDEAKEVAKNITG